jgi:uncharacterized protein YlxP (DUF503 family)
MIVSLYKIKIKLLGNITSLKEKRRIVSSVKNSIKNKFNVSIREVNYQDYLNISEIAMAYIALSSKELDKFEARIMENLFGKNIEIVNFERNLK